MGAHEPLPLPHLHHHHHHHRLFPPDLPCYDDFSAISGSEKSVSAASDKNVEAPGRDFSSGSSMGESPGPRLKFMCSFGGAILPRPGDGKLRYAGGDTRIVSVHLHISYADLMRKMRQFYGEAVLLKYQLPGEDLDALVSVTSDEDLENMTEEYMKLEASQGPSRLRIFLFSPAENDAVHQNLSAAQTNTDQIYVDAINGVSVAGLKGNLDMAGVSSSKNLRALEALEAWNASQFFENASEAMLGAPIRQRTSASFVQSPNVLSRIMLGSPSPPPPISTVPSQPPQVGQCAIPDLSLNFYPEQLAKIAVRGYELRLDEIHHELEGIGSASRSQLDGPYRPLESRSVSGSPTKTQQETMLAPLGKNLNESYPPEQLLMADSRMPRVDSRGRLMTRVDSYGRMPAVNSHSMLMPQQVEQAVSSDRPMDNNIPDILYLPLDVQHLYGQQQLHPSQAACQHPLEVGGDGQLKMDPVDFMQVQQHAQYHYQQITSQHYPLTDKSAREVSAFEQCVQQQEALNGQLPCKSMALQTNHNQFGTKAIPVPVSQLGSAPPSPHMPHWENNMKQNRGHLPVLQSAIGGFVDQPYGKMRGQPHIELANSLLKPANMPLHAQEQLPYIEDQVTFQQAPMPFGNLESLPKVQKGDPFHKENQALHSEFYDLDGVTRAMTPPYPGVTTYQDSSSSFSNCEMSRRDEFANNSCYIDKVHVIVQNTHNHSEEMSGGWTHAHKIDMREVMTSGFVSSQIAETSFVNAPSMRISEPSVGGVAVTDTYLTAQNTRSQFDPLGNTLVHSRSNLVPSAVAQHLPAPGRTLFSDSSQPGGDVLGTQVTMQAGTKILDTSAFPSSFKETVYAPALSIATARNSDVQLDGFGYVQTDSPLSAFPPVSSVSKTESVFLAKMEEGRWTEDSESGFHNPGVHLSEAAYDSTGVLVQDNELNRPASSRTAADPDDTLVKSEVLISKSTSNKSLLDDDTFVPLYSQTETVISNGTSYVIGIGVSTMGLSIFPTDITLSPRASTSAAGGSSVTSPCLNPVVEAFSVSSCLPHPLEDSSRGNLSSTKGVDLVESADMRAEVPVPDLRASITTFGVISVQASQGLEDREVSPRFGSGYVQEFGKHEDEDEGIQGNLEHVAKNVVAAVFKPTLHSSPTLSIQNWENALANVKLDEQVTEESLPVDKSLDEVKVNIDEKEVTFQDAKRGSQEAESDGLIKNKSMNLAAVAEAEAISRGLQTIKNLDLEELRELGSGTFGTVYHGKWRGTDVAIKRIKSSCFSGKPSERERLIADFWKEAYILGQLHHPNVVAFYGVVPDGPGDTLATVTEYMVNGSLKQVLQKKDRTIDRRKRLLIIMDAAFGMEYLHGKNIVHFDLKCENLLVNMKDPHRPICKVGDLGLSKVKHQTMVSGGVRGTLPWMAPELLNGSSNLVSEKVDVFSFGIVMWELLTGEEPYANMHYGAIIGGIVNNTLRPPVPSWCDPSWKSLMERCWSADPEERPAFSNIASELRAMATLASSKAA